MVGPSGGLPLRPREMRDRNRALVLDAVARHEPVTRTQLAARTGLTKSSVSSIVGELLAARLVVEQGAQRDGDQEPRRQRRGHVPQQPRHYGGGADDQQRHVVRRLQVRYERRADILLGLMQLACSLICLKSLNRPTV